jgi:hypothetical protein
LVYGLQQLSSGWGDQSQYIIIALVKGASNMRRLSAQVLIFTAFFAFTLCPIANAADTTPLNARGKSISLPKNFAPTPSANNLLRQRPSASSKITPLHAKRTPQLSAQRTRGESRWKSMPDRTSRSRAEF